MKKCLITFILGFSLIFSGMLISCNDPVNAKENTSINDSNTEDSSETTKKDEPEKSDEKNSEEKSEETKKEDAKQDDSKTDETPAASTFTVSFNTAGGTAETSQTINKGEKATKPATDPTKTGCTFGGWYTSTDGGKTLSSTAFDFNTAINANTTLYAKWNIAEGYYKVTFELNGGTLSTGNFVSVKSGEKVEKPADPSKDGYEFVNWYSDSECTTAFDFTNTTISAVTSIYAKWRVLGTGVISLNQKKTREITMTKSNGSYTFTVSQLPEDLNLPEGTTLNYTFALIGQDLVITDFLNNQTVANKCTTNNNYWSYTGSLTTGKDYKVLVTINSNTSNISKDIVYLYFKG